jgi:NAD(P)-dependent dehydrogenase (short-subunit alcohol dehydrogenase family)
MAVHGRRSDKPQLTAIGALRPAEAQEMDLGIEDKRAIVCAASKGLGRACALALAREGAQVTISARTSAALEATAHEIEAETGKAVAFVAADITTPAGYPRYQCRRRSNRVVSRLDAR